MLDALKSPVFPISDAKRRDRALPSGLVGAEEIVDRFDLVRLALSGAATDRRGERRRKQNEQNERDDAAARTIFKYTAHKTLLNGVGCVRRFAARSVVAAFKELYRMFALLQISDF